MKSIPHAAISSLPQVDTPLHDVTTLLATAGQDAILIGIAGGAAVLWVGSFIFLSLPQMRSRYPVRVAAGLSFLQSVFVFALAAIVVPTIALRVLAVLWCVYYLLYAPMQAFYQWAWQRRVSGKKVVYKSTPKEGEHPPSLSPGEVERVYGDMTARYTAWPLSLQLAGCFIVIAVWPTKYCVAIVSVFLIWQGSRFVRSALLDEVLPKAIESPRGVDPEVAFRRLRLGWLLRFRFIQQRIEEYKASHPLGDASVEGGPNA